MSPISTSFPNEKGFMPSGLIKIHSKIVTAFITLLVIFLAIIIAPVTFGTLAVRKIFGLKTIDYPAEPYSEMREKNLHNKQIDYKPELHQLDFKYRKENETSRNQKMGHP